MQSRARHIALLAVLLSLLATTGCGIKVEPPDDTCGPCELSHGHGN